MASSEDYLEYALDLLREVDGITYLKMMGEYIFKRYDVIFGGLYDNRFLVKKTSKNAKYEMKEAIPYPGAKPMYLVNTEDSELIREIVLDSLPDKKFSGFTKTGIM